MKIHEYQAKSLLKKYNIPIQDGVTIESLSEAEGAIKQVSEDYNTDQFVIKAQIHAGGRGKGGGVKFTPTKEDALDKINDILGMTLITHQTGSEGRLVKKVMVGEAIDIKKEYYVAITLDRSSGKDVFMVSSEGGVEIEEVAKNNPEKIVREAITPGLGLLAFQARNLSKSLGLEGKIGRQAGTLFQNLYAMYKELNCSIVEINPLVLTEQDDILALDAKVNFDSNALFMHPEIVEMRDLNEEDPAEVEADKYHLNYIKLEGNVGCMVNGAGLAMATMDIIKLYGEEPANFLDVGGGASKEKVSEALKIIISDKNVKGILINIFGGIMKCDVLAQGVVDAAKEVKINVPLVVRLAGTNFQEGKTILDNSGLKLISAENLDDAANKIVKAIK